MKINNETKVGLLTIVSLVLLVLGFNFLKGKDTFNNTPKIYAVFSKLGALKKSNEVVINGFTIGKVSDTKAIDKNISGIVVTISLSEDVNIPANSVAYITAPFGGLSSPSIVVEKGDATTFLKSGDTLHTRVDEGLFGGLSAEVSPTLLKIRATLDSLNRVLGNINLIFDDGTKGNLRQAIGNLTAATGGLNKMLGSENGALMTSLNNISSITGNLKKNNDSITSVISNANRFAKGLAGLQLEKTMDSLQLAIGQLKTTMGKISSKDGTLGALINDKALYNKLYDVMLSAEILVDDLRTHPKRYVNLSVFGKKDKGGALTSPIKKDSIPQ